MSNVIVELVDGEVINVSGPNNLKVFIIDWDFLESKYIECPDCGTNDNLLVDASTDTGKDFICNACGAAFSFGKSAGYWKNGYQY